MTRCVAPPRPRTVALARRTSRRGAGAVVALLAALFMALGIGIFFLLQEPVTEEDRVRQTIGAVAAVALFLNSAGVGFEREIGPYFAGLLALLALAAIAFARLAAPRPPAR